MYIPRLARRAARTHWAKLVRVSANSRTFEVTVPIAAPKSDTASHTIAFWSQDDAGNVEVRTTKTFTVAASAAGASSLRYKFAKRGTYYVMARYLGSATFDHCDSKYVKVVVR